MELQSASATIRLPVPHNESLDRSLETRASASPGGEDNRYHSDAGDMKGVQPAIDTIATIPSNPSLRLEDPFGMVTTIGYQDLEEVVHWFSVSQLDSRSSGNWVAVAENSWGQTVWNAASNSASSFAALLLLIAHKQAVLTGRSNPEQLYALTNCVIRHIRNGINNSRTAPPSGTALAVCAMALFALRERQFETAKMHMQAAYSLVQAYPLDSESWNFCAWVDLLLAIAFAWRPFLPYRPAVPGFSVAIEMPSRSPEARKLALKAVRLVPLHQDAGFGEHEAFDLFTSLAETCFAAEYRTTALVAPWYLLYDLAYRLCNSLGSIAPSGAWPDTELLLTCLQLCFWCAARYWLPQPSHTRRQLIERMLDIINRPPTMLATWYQQGCNQCLLWIAVTGLMSAARYDTESCLKFLPIIKQTCQELKVHRSQDIRRLLLPFPAVQAEREEAIKTVWRELRAAKPNQWVETEQLSQKQVAESQSRRYLSIFQFDTSS